MGVFEFSVMVMNEKVFIVYIRPKSALWIALSALFFLPETRLRRLLRLRVGARERDRDLER